MITLKDLNLLINHLHQANRIFDTEALIEERKHRHAQNEVDHDKRSGHAPRSFLLHHKADIVATIEQKLLEECEHATVTLDESTVYTARELVAESVYPWIHRREPPLSYIDELLDDETFTPFAFRLDMKRQKLMDSGLHVLLLPPELQYEISSHIETKKIEKRNDVTITVADIISFGITNLSKLFKEEREYKTKLVIFRMYTLGIIYKEDVRNMY